jgi:hypothetical protein
MKRAICGAVLCLLSSGCVSHNWVPGPNATGDSGMTSGRCKLAALSGESSGFVAASGNPRFVGIAVGSAMIGQGISTAVRQQNIYNACMEASGFVAADERPVDTSPGPGSSGLPGASGGGPGEPTTLRSGAF